MGAATLPLHMTVLQRAGPGTALAIETLPRLALWGAGTQHSTELRGAGDAIKVPSWTALRGAGELIERLHRTVLRGGGTAFETLPGPRTPACHRTEIETQCWTEP